MTNCDKTRFHTELGAKIALAKLRWKDRDENRAYYCTRCKAWHLTSQKVNE